MIDHRRIHLLLYRAAIQSQSDLTPTECARIATHATGRALLRIDGITEAHNGSGHVYMCEAIVDAYERRN